MTHKKNVAVQIANAWMNEMGRRKKKIHQQYQWRTKLYDNNMKEQKKELWLPRHK